VDWEGGRGSGDTSGCAYVFSPVTPRISEVPMCDRSHLEVPCVESYSHLVSDGGRLSVVPLVGRENKQDGMLRDSPSAPVVPMQICFGDR
jgi:hypothetical protein